MAGHADSTGYIDAQDKIAIEHAPDENGKYDNKKREAIKVVLDSLDSAETALGLDLTSSESPEVKLTEGMGKDGSVWNSTFAETARENISGILSDISRDFRWTRDDVQIQYWLEPEKVDSGDPRASWDL